MIVQTRRFIVVVLLLAASLAAAQVRPVNVTPANDTGIQPYGSYAGVHESVNLSNGNVHIEIPLLSLKGRNGQNLTLTAQYDSKIWNLSGSRDEMCNADVYVWSAESHDPSIGLGWRLNIPYLSGGQPNLDGEGTPTGTFAPYIFTDWNGGKHLLQSPGNSYAFSDSDKDESSVRLFVRGTGAIVWTMDGVTYAFPTLNGTLSVDSKPTTITDADGNTITFDADGTIHDNLNRRITFTNGNINYIDSNGAKQTVQINTSALALTPTFARPLPRNRLCTSAYTIVVKTSYPTQNKSISSIVLPNNDTYSFQYNGFGEITKVTYPTGGYTNYSYLVKTYANPVALGMNPQADFREISDKTECASPSSCATTHYVYNDVGTANNDIADVYENYGGNPVIHTQHGFSQASTPYYGDSTPGAPIPAVEVLNVAYGSTGNQLRSVQTQYTSYPLLPSLVTTTLDDNTQFHETFQYDSYTASICTYTNFCGPETRLLPNVTQHNVYDFQGNLVRQSNTTWYHGYDSSYHLVSLKQHEEVGNGTQISASTDFTIDNYTLGNPLISATAPAGQASGYGTSRTQRGKVTSVTRHSLVNCGTDSTEIFQYDTLGNLRTYKDAKNHLTTVSYAAGVTGNCNSDLASSPLVDTTGSFVTSITRDNGLQTNYSYNACTGSLATAVDANARTTTYSYDLIGRLISTVINSDGATITNEYHENATPPYLLTTNVGKVSKAILDGLGRSVQTITCEDSPNCSQQIVSDIAYDFRHRKISESNPHRSTAAATDGFTTYAYDELNRVKSITKQDGSIVQTAFAGTVTTVTDEAGRTRESTADVLGRMIKVREDVPTGPTLTYITNYSYDILGNLITVAQNGDNPSNARNRSFTYNGKSELCTATNPETGNTGTGTISYQYDADGEVTLKTFNSGNAITYSYDTIHRLTGKSYSAVDPARATDPVTYTYDSIVGGNLGKGYRTGMVDGSGNTSWLYDARGRISKDTRSINTGQATLTRETVYAFNIDSSLASIQYPHVAGDPSPQTVTYSYDAIGRALTALLPQLDPTKNISVSGAQFGATGALAKVTFGTGIQGAFSYTKRLQARHLLYTTGAMPSDASLDQQACPTAVGNIMHMVYNFGPDGSNNGNLQTATNCKDTTRNETFTYDYLNRVTSASTPTGSNNYWSQTFEYDSWANLKRVTPQGLNTPGFGLLNVMNSNQVGTLSQYDADGNLIHDGLITYTYDVENRIKSIYGGASYKYDGDGRRVVKSNGTAYWTGTGSEALTETDLSSAGTVLAEYVFFGGTRVARIDNPLGQSSSVHYYFADLIKSTNVVTGSTGSVQAESMFYPFGGERVITAGDANHYKFTGKERDASAQETGLDFFGARYYVSAAGRWMSPDWSAAPQPVPYANLANPQSLNLYAYVGNNPVTGVDPDGHMSAALYGWGGKFASPEASNKGVGIFNRGMSGMPAAPTATIEIHTGDSTIFIDVPADSAPKAATQQPAEACDSKSGRNPGAAKLTFKTEKGAAMAAEKAALALTGNSEWGGWILAGKKGYTFTVPVTFAMDGHFCADKVEVPRGYAGVAEYHTHPGGSENEGFSKIDFNRSNALGWNSYVGSKGSGNVFVCIPGQTRWMGFNKVTGDKVGNVNPE